MNDSSVVAPDRPKIGSSTSNLKVRRQFPQTLISPAPF
jgi:hypothetical protein